MIPKKLLEKENIFFWPCKTYASLHGQLTAAQLKMRTSSGRQDIHQVYSVSTVNTLPAAAFKTLFALCAITTGLNSCDPP